MNEPASLHWATTWVPAVEKLWSSAVPAVFACFIVGPVNVVLFFVPFVIVPTVLYYTIRYWTVTFQVLPGELIIHSGVFNRRERRIPLDRIQESELQQDLSRRMLGITRLVITTAGGDSEEAVLDAITEEQARYLQRLTHHGDSLPSASSRDSISEQSSDAIDVDYECRLSLRELLIGGMTSNVVASLLAIASTIAYFQFSMERGWRWIGGPRVPNRLPGNLGKVDDFLTTRAEEWIPDLGPLNFVVELAFADTLFRGLAVVVIGLVVSIATFVFRYHGFWLRRDEDLLTVSHGLLTRHEGRLSRLRIQSLKLEEGLLRRMMGLASVRVDSAGDREKVDENKNRDVLLPVASRSVAMKVARQAITGLPNLNPTWQRVSPLAVMRGTKKGWLAVVAAMLQAYVWSPPLALALLPAFPLVYGLNRVWYRHAGYSVTDDHLLYQKGWLNRSTYCLPIMNIQNVVLSQSPFDRRLKLATVVIDTAGQSNTGGCPVIRHLPLERAVVLKRTLSKRVSETAFGW